MFHYSILKYPSGANCGNSSKNSLFKIADSIRKNNQADIIAGGCTFVDNIYSCSKIHNIIFLHNKCRLLK